MKLTRDYMMATISFAATLLLTLTAELLNLGQDISYLIFAIGTMLTLATTLLEKQVENHLEDKMSRNLNLYRLTKEIDDDELQSEVFKFVKSMSQGEIPPYISAIRSTKLFERAKKTVHAADYNPTARDILRWEGSRLATWYKSGVDAVKRGVVVERIFILKREEALKDGKWDKDILRILQRQSNDGIKVRVLWIEEVTMGDVHPQRDVLRNIVTFDDMEVLITTHEPQIFRLPSDRVREFIDVFEEQKKFSRTLDEILIETDV